MLFWSCVDFTSGRLLFNALWTDWVCLGTRLEQVDLASDFGEDYEKYRGRVPMLIPGIIQLGHSAIFGFTTVQVSPASHPKVP
jgi:hypothetical protein